MAISLQLLMLVIATTLATTSFAANPVYSVLSGLYVVVGTQHYVCDTNSGVYVAATFDAQLYDGMDYVEKINLLKQLISDINDYQKANPSGVDNYIDSNFGFPHAGQVISSGGNTEEFQIVDKNTGQLQTDMSFTIESGTQSIQGLLVTNGGNAVIVITNPNAPPACPCTPGSSPAFTLPAAQMARWTTYVY